MIIKQAAAQWAAVLFVRYNIFLLIFSTLLVILIIG